MRPMRGFPDRLRAACGLTSLCLLATLLAAGCSTPSSRIKQRPEVFASFPPGVQENVRSGRIAVGYTHDMVYIALGSPSRMYQRETESGRTEIWSYTDIRYTTDVQPVETTYRYRDARGHLRLSRDWGWADVSRSEEFETLRVEFRDGKVAAIERLNR